MTNEHLLLMLDSAAEGIIEVDLQGTFVFCNKAALFMLGYSEQSELTGKNLHNLIHHSTKDGSPVHYTECKIHKAIAGGFKRHADDEVFRTRQGTCFPVEYWSYPLVKDDKVLGAVLTFLDITDRKAIEEELEKSREDFRAIADYAASSESWFNMDGKLLWTSSYISKLTGYTVEVCLAADDYLSMIIAPEDLDRVRKLFSRAVQGETGVGEEILLRRKDGSTFWFSVSWQPMLDAKGNIRGIRTSGQDVTQRRRIHEELRNSEERYRLLAENSRDVIWTMALDGAITYISPAVEQLRGFTVEEAMNQPLDQILTPRSQAIVIDYFQNLHAAIQSGQQPQGLRTEHEYYCKDGSTLWCEVIVFPVMDAYDRLESLLGVSRDISERKQFEAQLMEQADNLRELVAVRDKFFSIIAHDLRSPFNGFLNLTQIMMDQFHNLSSGQLHEFIADLNTSANNLFELLENLLEWSQHRRGLMHFTPATIALNSIFSSALRTLHELANNKEISIEMEVPEELTVYADQKMLESTIRNLLSNAIKFTPKGGQVSITAKPADDDQVEVSIKDIGIGMSQEILSKLFRLEENVSRKGTDGESSTGLGLHLCKDFVEKNGGTLWVESTEGSGTTFYFTVPCASNADGNNTQGIRPPSTKKKTDGKIKALVVDDDIPSKRLLLYTLKQQGFEVLEAGTGVEAVTVCRSVPDLDLIFMDINMPLMDGCTAVKKIREFNKEVVIIIQTASMVNPDARIKALKCGSNDYITKPVHFDDLQELVHRYFEISNFDTVSELL